MVGTDIITIHMRLTDYWQQWNSFTCLSTMTW
jgi:hypothetical protein